MDLLGRFTPVGRSVEDMAIAGILEQFCAFVFLSISRISSRGRQVNSIFMIETGGFSSEGNVTAYSRLGERGTWLSQVWCRSKPTFQPRHRSFFSENSCMYGVHSNYSVAWAAQGWCSLQGKGDPIWLACTNKLGTHTLDDTSAYIILSSISANHSRSSHQQITVHSGVHDGLEKVHCSQAPWYL